MENDLSLLGPIEVEKLIRVKPDLKIQGEESNGIEYTDETLRKLMSDNEEKDSEEENKPKNWQELKIKCSFFWKDISYVEESYMDKMKNFCWTKYKDTPKVNLIKHNGECLTVVGTFDDFHKNHSRWFSTTISKLAPPIIPNGAVGSRISIT